MNNLYFHVFASRRYASSQVSSVLDWMQKCFYRFNACNPRLVIVGLLLCLFAVQREQVLLAASSELKSLFLVGLDFFTNMDPIG
jgi:hypothetical protein